MVEHCRTAPDDPVVDSGIGVTLLEKDIGERRLNYADHVRHANAFFPGIPKQR
jgi:steroid 5-alpha reductase family enzyme